MEVEEISPFSFLPTEIICYTFTFLYSREDIKTVGLVCRDWNDALLHEEIWRNAFTRFYGEVSDENIVLRVRSWSQIFRRRSLQGSIIHRLTRAPRLQGVSQERILNARLIGGSHRTCIVQVEKNLYPFLVHLSHGTVDTNVFEGGNIAPSYTHLSSDGKRVIFGTATGVVYVYQYGSPESESMVKKSKSSLNREPTKIFTKVATYSDGHNLATTPQRTIEFVTENLRYLVSVANNNSIAIWDKYADHGMFAHGYTKTERSEMRKEAEDFDDHFERAARRLNAERERNERANAIRKVAEQIRLEREQAEARGEEPEQRNPNRYGIRQDAIDLLDGNLVIGNAPPAPKIEPSPEPPSEEDGEQPTPKPNIRFFAVNENLAPDYHFGREIQTRGQYIRKLGIDQVRNILADDSSPLLIKSLVFKYPPSVVYIVPGDSLQLVLGLKSGSVLEDDPFFKRLTLQLIHVLLFPVVMFLISSAPVDHVIGFLKDDETYLITISSRSLEMVMWNVTPSHESVSRTGRENMLCKVKLTKPVTKLEWSAAHESLILETPSSIQVWDLYTPGALRKSSSTQILFMLYEISRETKQIANSLHIVRNGLIFVNYEDSSSEIFFIPTGQVVGKNPPLNTYFTPFQSLIDKNTFAQVDSSGIYWKNLGKFY